MGIYMTGTVHKELWWKWQLMLRKEWRSGDGESDWGMISCKGNKTMFRKEVKRVRKREQARIKMVKDVNGQMLRDGVESTRRWAGYFKQVLNVEDARDGNINVIGDRRMPVLGELNERAISIEEVREAVNEMKSGKAPGLDGFPVECLTICLRTVIPVSSDFGQYV